MFILGVMYPLSCSDACAVGCEVVDVCLNDGVVSMIIIMGWCR